MTENTAAPAGAAGTMDIGGDLTVNRLGYGAMRVTGPDVLGPPADRAEALATLRRAVELGVNFIDTADTYGPYISEELICEALYPYPADLIIMGKGGRVRPASRPASWSNNGRPEHLVEVCEGSLRRLRLEEFAVYLLHHPDEKVPLEESVGALADLKQQGKIRHIGLSNVNEDQLRRAQSVTPIVAIENRYAPTIRASESLVDLCEQEELTFIPFASIRDMQNTSVADDIARRHDATARQVVLAWLLARSPTMVPIPGTGSVRHLEENVNAATIELTDAEVAAMTAID